MKNNTLNFKKTALVSALMLASGAHAATINVDGVTCNLNDAVLAANTDAVVGGCTAGVGDDVLELPVDGTINITDTLEVLSTVTVNGNGSLIQPDPAGAAVRVFLAGNYGGGTGDLTINDAIVANGISDGSPGRNFGGGVRAYGSVLNINNSTFTDNAGGAVVFTGSTGSINNSVIQDSTSYASSYYGAGVSVAGSTVTISNSTITNNDNIATTNGGGGIYATSYGGPLSLTIENSTISGNTADVNGGGISHVDYGNASSITLTNVTLAANSTAGAGGGISNDVSNITISQSLVSGNSGTGGTEINSTGGTITVDDYNLFGLNSTSGVVGVTVGASDMVPTEATLAEIVDVSLADNGGPTPTHALAEDSPAIDAVPAASCASATDQTGKARPIDGDGDSTADCDIGAFENEEGVNPDIIFKDGFE